MAAKKQTKTGTPKKTADKAVKRPAAKAKAAPQPKTAPAKKKPVAKVASKAVTPTAKKAATKKPLTKVAPLKPAKKTAPAKSPAKPVAAKKSPVPAKHTAPAPKPALKPLPKPAPAHDLKKVRLSKSDLDHFKSDLLAMRDRITGQSGSMRNAALQRNDEINPEEDGTDAFMRLQTLEQVSSQQQIVANIDEALRMIEKGAYGVCDMCGELIGKARLAVLPFAKNCIKCQSEMERPRHHGGRR